MRPAACLGVTHVTATVVVLALFGSTLAPALAAASSSPDSALKLWFRQPAGIWEEALPVGNGRIGAMVYGGVLRDHIQLNEETIWSGVPTPANADPVAREERRRRQELIFQGCYREAQDLKLDLSEVERADLQLGKPEIVPGTSTARHVYQPLGDLYLHFDYGPTREENYRRELDLDTAIATTTYSVNGTNFTREVFASHPGQALVIRLTADQPGAVSFAATLDYRRDVEADMNRCCKVTAARSSCCQHCPRNGRTDA